MFQKLYIYIIIDVLAEQLVLVYSAANDAAAIRYFSDFINQKGSLPNMHSEDFHLRCIGQLNESNGLDVHDHLVYKGLTVKQANEQDEFDYNNKPVRPL